MERVLQITEAVIDDLRNKSPASAEDLTVEDFLSHIYLLRVHDPVEQLAVVNTLPTLLDEHKEVGLPVISRIEMWFSISGSNRDYKCAVKRNPLLRGARDDYIRRIVYNEKIA